MIGNFVNIGDIGEPHLKTDGIIGGNIGVNQATTPTDYTNVRVDSCDTGKSERWQVRPTYDITLLDFEYFATNTNALLSIATLHCIA